MQIPVIYFGYHSTGSDQAEVLVLYLQVMPHCKKDYTCNKKIEI